MRRRLGPPRPTSCAALRTGRVPRTGAWRPLASRDPPPPLRLLTWPAGATASPQRPQHRSLATQRASLASAAGAALLLVLTLALALVLAPTTLAEEHDDENDALPPRMRMWHACNLQDQVRRTSRSNGGAREDLVEMRGLDQRKQPQALWSPGAFLPTPHPFLHYSKHGVMGVTLHAQ